MYNPEIAILGRFVMIFQSVLLGNIVSLCMKIINSVVVVGLYYGFLTTFYMGPSYLFLLRAQFMEEVTEKGVSATTGFLTGQLMMFISIYYAPLHQALGRPHTITVLALPYLLFHFFWNNHKNFLYYGPTTRNLMRKLSIQCVFLNNLIFQLFNYFILPSSMVARLVNIYMFRCNNKILFVTSSFVGWLIVHIFFMKWLGLLLVWIHQNNSIRSNKYLVSELRNSMARIFTILLFITCVYYLGRIPLPILTNKPNKLKQTSKTKEGVESKKKRDLGIEKTSKIKGTKQAQKKSTEEDPSSSLFSKLTKLNEKMGKNEKKEQKNRYILFRLAVEDFEKSLVTLLFDHNRWNRPFRYIKKKRSEGSVRNEMAQHFFDIPKNKTNVKKKISFTYSPSLFIFLEKITKRFLLTLTKTSFFYIHYLYPKNQKRNNKSMEFQTRIETLEKKVTFHDILETRIRLCTDGTRNDYFSKMYDPLLNSSYCLNIKKKVPKNLKTYKENLRETVGINQIHDILFTSSNSETMKLKKDEALYNKKFSISSNNLLLLTDEFDTKTPQNLNLNPCLLSDQEGVNTDFKKERAFFKIFFKTVRNHPNFKKKSSGLKEIRKRVPRRSYELITEFQQKSGKYPTKRGQIRSRKTRFIVILNPIKQKTINNSNKDTKKKKDANINRKDLRKQIFLVRYYQQSDFRRGIIKGSIRAQRRKICMWEPFQANVHSPLFLDIIKKSPCFSFDRSELIKAICPNWIHNRIDFKFFENTDEKIKKEHKKETDKTYKKEENKRQEQIRANIADAWNRISTARKARSLLLITQSKFRKYILLPLLIIAKNIGRMVLLQIPEWVEDLQEWNRELHIICTYNGIQLSETEFPQNWLREGMQIKILFPFCLKPWRRSKLRPYYMQNKKENNDFCFLTVWGLETNFPFGFPRQRSSFFKPILKKLKTKIKKSKNSYFLVQKTLRGTTKFISKQIKRRVFSKFNPILFFNTNKVYKLNQIKNNKYSTNINEIIPESLINQVQSSNHILTEKKNKDITARSITIRNQIERMTKDKKKNTRIYISDNKRIYKIYKEKRLEFSNFFFEIIKRQNVRLISKIHFLINFFFERIYINYLLSIINLSKPIRQLFLDSINKFIKKFININEADKEKVNQKKENKIHFISIIKKPKNSQKCCYLSYLSQAYVFYNLSQIQGINLNKLRYVFKYHDYGIPFFVKTKIKVKDSFEGVIYLELNHNKYFNSGTNHWKTWVKKLNRYRQYNSYNSKASRKKISQHPMVQNCKKDSYEKDILILFKKENPVEAYFVQTKKDNLKKNSRYDLLSYQSSNSETKRDLFIYGSTFETQVNKKQDSYSNTNTQKYNFFNIRERSSIINYIGKSEIKSTKKKPERKYFDWKTLHFDLRQKIAIEYWIKIDTNITNNTKIKTNNYQLTDKIVKNTLFYLALPKKLKIKVPNPPKTLLDWMGMNEEIRKCPISTLNFNFWFFPEFLLLSNLYKMKPWVIPSKRLLLRKEIEEGYVGSKVTRSKKKKQYKKKAETELNFLMKRYLLFQFRWDDTLNQRIINNIKLFCLLIRLLNSRKIVISSIQQREMTLDRLLIQNSLNVVELIKKGILVIEPVRLSVKNDSQFILYQTLCISLVHKSKHKNNQGYPEQTDINNNFIDLLAPETILSHKYRREFRMKISFNFKNTNKNLGFCITNNCSQFVDRHKHKEKNELIKIQFLTCSNCQLEDLACMNRYWFDTNNGSRFSMLRIYMYSELKHCW
uniref:Protein TIC 214 n=1 Tax=Gentiana zollingeri TaxID=553064 RepID=A0A8K1YJY7_9GENT|nr:hypothetical protein RF1 [Gentiana zollingeri]UBR43127.1 hypothetical protein RF1 [Gentiana zollingeri]